MISLQTRPSAWRARGPSLVTRFPSSLAIDGRVGASTQNQALEVDLPWLDGIVCAKRPRRLPVVLTRDEVRAVLKRPGMAPPRLMAYLLYGGRAPAAPPGASRSRRASCGVRAALRRPRGLS